MVRASRCQPGSVPSGHLPRVALPPDPFAALQHQDHPAQIEPDGTDRPPPLGVALHDLQIEDPGIELFASFQVPDLEGDVMQLRIHRAVKTGEGDKKRPAVGNGWP